MPPLHRPAPSRLQTWALALALVASGCVLATDVASAQPGYFRSPAVHGTTVVFTAEGDLWTVPLTGGKATRLTTAQGQERSAHISPDGKWVAYTSDDGPVQSAWVMPLAGGTARRLTYSGRKAIVVGWTPAGEVVYRTDTERNAVWTRRTVALHPQKKTERTLPPLADVTDVAVTGSGSAETVLLTRFGLSITGDNSFRYRGGAMGQLWRWKAGDREATRLLSAVKASMSDPMILGTKLIVLSDESGSPNLWVMDLDGRNRRQLTTLKDFPVRSPDGHGNTVVFQHGADLNSVDVRTGKVSPIPIRLVSDFVQRQPRWVKHPQRYLSSIRMSPDDDRVALTARGDVAIMAPDTDVRVRVARKGARVKSAVLSADGKWVYGLADVTGTMEIWRFAADGSAKREQLTRNAKAERLRLWLSPDGKTLVHSDGLGRLYALDTASGKSRVLDDTSKTSLRNWWVGDVAFSADSKAVAFVRPTTLALRDQIVVQRLDTGQRVTVTSDRYRSASPAFSRDGRWLYFLSDRHFKSSVPSPWGDRVTGPYFENRARVYAVALDPAAEFPFEDKDARPPKPKQPGAKKAKKTTKDAKKKSANDKAKPAPMVLKGLSERLRVVPVPPGNYRRLRVDGKRLYLSIASPGGPPTLTLKTFEMKPKTKGDVFAAGVSGFDVDSAGKRVLVVTGRWRAKQVSLVPAGAKAPKDGKGKVDLGGWHVQVDPVAEWANMFLDAWRMHRDSFYDARMRGVDWDAQRRRYARLLPRLADRADLDDLLAQLVGPLESLHSQIARGDNRSSGAVARPASLGGRFTRTKEGYRVDYLYRGDSERPGTLGPLLQPGVDVRPGDVITTVSGRSLKTLSLAEALLNHAGRKVDLTFQRKGKSRVVRVRPVNPYRELSLLAQDWERARRERVLKASGGRFGYFRLNAMGARDAAHFAREYYANLHRDGLIIDVRRNQGGSIDSWVVGTLLQKRWAYWQRRNGPHTHNMHNAFGGKIVVLIDELTYSDGETFAAAVKSLKLGTVIGRRTAGAGVWLSARNRVVDGGLARLPEYPQYDPRGRWIVEGKGVSPDIEVENPPAATYAGGDAQLDRALQWLRKNAPRRSFAPKPIPPSGTDARDAGPL